jgi:phospholipase/carboxylesterase
MDRQGGSCLTVLGVWAIFGGVVCFCVVVLVIFISLRGKRAPVVEAPAGPQSFACTQGGCEARMGGPSRWARTTIPGVSDPAVVLVLESKGSHDAALVVRDDPLERDLTPEDAVESFLQGNFDGQKPQQVWRGDVKVGDEPGSAAHVRLTQGGIRSEGYVAFAIRNDHLFMVTALSGEKDFVLMNGELLSAVRTFRLPPVERFEQKPEPPLAIPLPEAPPIPASSRDAGADLLLALAQAAAIHDPDEAMAFQRAAVDKGAFSGEYNLACFAALAGRTDAALYWLQRAAADEGVDGAWAEEDDDLVKLRADARWPQVRAYFRRMARYWSSHTPEQQLVVIPKAPAPAAGRPLVVGMHGLGSRPEDFSGIAFQSAAERAGVAFVALSGTNARGPHKFVWAEDPALDRARIDRGIAAIAAIAGQVTPPPGKVITIGFSQGAQMAVEIAARDPAHFAGAIVMSPGTRKDLRLADIPSSVSLAGRRFVVVVGAREHPRNVIRAKADADRLRALGAQVYYYPYPDMNSHSFPPDFDVALPKWIAFILDGKPL